MTYDSVNVAFIAVITFGESPHGIKSDSPHDF